MCQRTSKLRRSVKVFELLISCLWVGWCNLELQWKLILGTHNCSGSKRQTRLNKIFSHYILQSQRVVRSNYGVHHVIHTMGQSQDDTTPVSGLLECSIVINYNIVLYYLQLGQRVKLLHDFAATCCINIYFDLFDIIYLTYLSTLVLPYVFQPRFSPTSTSSLPGD